MASLNDEAPLSKKEQEEEEMRNELKDAGVYDDNMDVKEMRELIAVLNVSKQDIRKPIEDTIDNYMLLQENKLSQDSENSAGLLPSFCIKQSDSSNALMAQNTPSKESKSNNDKNLESSSSSSYEKKHIENSPSSGEIYDKNSIFKQDEDFPLLGNRYKTRSCTAEGPRTRSQEIKKTSLPTVKKSSLERWQLDPLEFVKNVDRTPLYQSLHSDSHLAKSMPYCNKEIDFYSEEFDKMCQQMNEKLGIFNNQCMMEFETTGKRAAPIKINHEEASVSKIPIKEKASSISIQGPSTSSSNTCERSAKRKALPSIAAVATYENIDDEFCNTKKRKFLQEKKEDEEVKKNQEKQNKNIDESTESISIDDFKDNFDIEFDRSDLHNIRQDSNNKVSTNNLSDEQQSQYPRRIEPPIIAAKKSFKGPRAKKKNSTQIQNKSDSEKRTIFLNDEEIYKTLQEINKHIDENDCIEISDDRKPPPMPKPIDKRLKLATNHLENIRDQKEQKLKAEKEAKEQKEREERLKMDELMCIRLQEQENRNSRRLENERKLNEQSAFYMNVLDNRTRVTRSNFQRNITEEEIAEDLLLNGDDDEPTITKVIEKLLCPICQKPYPADVIAAHASGCDEYVTDSSDLYNRPSTSRFLDIYKCHLCDKYETSNGNLYEDHVASCRNLMNGSWISK